MNLRYLFFVLLFGQMCNAQSSVQFREMIKKAQHSESETKTFINKAEAAYSKSGNALYQGFHAVGNFLMVKHVFNPLKKMSYFKEGKHLMEMAIKAAPDNVELRLMRLMTQENIPRLLGYHQHIEEDRKFLKKAYPTVQDAEIKKYMKEKLKL